MTQPRILVIEDDSSIREGIVDALRFQRLEPLEASDGKVGARMALAGEYDLLLLDLVLPNRDGLDILRELRELRPTMPVIILTARGDEKDRIAGLKLGADDYVVKPFSIDELLARVEAVLRRSPQRSSDVREFPIPHGRVDFDRCEVRFDEGERAELSERERELLRYLVCNAGRAISRDEILSHVWRLEPRGLTTRTIDVHIGRLRQKLRDDLENPRILLTVRGKGYMFASSEVSENA
jgi:DNA-binding response OmpR family regulator